MNPGQALIAFIEVLEQLFSSYTDESQLTASDLKWVEATAAEAIEAFANTITAHTTASMPDAVDAATELVESIRLAAFTPAETE